MENIREMETTVLQDMAKSVSFYTSLGLDAYSSESDISRVAKKRAKDKFDSDDNDRTMKELIRGQEYFLSSIRTMIQSKITYREEYNNRLNALKLEDANSIEDQLGVLFLA